MLSWLTITLVFLWAWLFSRWKLSFHGGEFVAGCKKSKQIFRSSGIARPRSSPGCYTPPMYAQKLRVDVIVCGERKPCPLDWLDAFCMRNFTGSAEFDDTLPIGEGKLEASLKVNAERFAAAFGEWLKKVGKTGGKPVTVEIHTL